MYCISAVLWQAAYVPLSIVQSMPKMQSDHTEEVKYFNLQVEGHAP